MGIEYYLVKEEEKELFELGKGCWSRIFNRGESILKERYNFPHTLYRDILAHIAPSFDKLIPLQYFQDLAKNIFDWAGNSKVCLKNDTDFEDGGRERYTQTGTRYIKYPSKPKDILKECLDVLKYGRSEKIKEDVIVKLEALLLE